MGEFMDVRLISITQPSDGIMPNPESLSAYCARVSNLKNQDNIETAPKLLKYCIDNKHWSVFEMVDFTVEIKTSRAIAQQIIRHKSFSFQEFSMRYSKVSQYEEYEARKQDLKNRQNSTNDLTDGAKKWFKVQQAQIWTNSYDKYNQALEMGIAKECARFLLPLNTQTTLFMKGSLRSWIHYLTLRCDNATQKEHRDVANKIKEIFIKEFPETSKAMGWIN
jgi:thymidylate synthase (FAD)